MEKLRLRKIVSILIKKKSISEHDMFIWLMSKEDNKTTKLLGKFCKSTFEIRTKYFNNVGTQI